MKGSGVEWIGEIPKHWETRRLKVALVREKEIVDKYSGEDILSLTMNGVIVRDLVNPKGKMPTTFDGYQVISKGNLITCLFDIDVTPRCVGVAYSDGLTSPAYTQYKVINNFYTDFIYYYLLMLDNDKILVPITKSLRNTIKSEDFLNLEFSFPDFQSQKKISEYITSSILNINQIISDTQQSIEELKKYKQLLITEVVTKGLDKNIEMKDSGIEWIGNIPNNFLLAKLGNITNKIGSGKTPTGGESVYSKEGILFIRSQNVYNEGLQLEEARFITEEIHQEMSNSSVEYEDILLNITGGSIGRAAVYLLDVTANVNQHVCILRPKKELVLSKWIHFCLMSNIGEQSVKYFQTGGNREGLNFNDISKICIPLPSLNQQKVLIDELIKIEDTVNQLIEEKKSIIKEYEKYKKTIIYEYVTGKKQV